MADKQWFAVRTAFAVIFAAGAGRWWWLWGAAAVVWPMIVFAEFRVWRRLRAASPRQKEPPRRG